MISFGILKIKSMRQFKATERMTLRSGKSISCYYREVEGIKQISPEEEVKLAERISRGDMEARDILAQANLRFVISVAKMYTMDQELFNDLIAVGNIGLIEAAEKFDPSRGFKFISFAVWHIRKEMLKYLSDNSRTIRIPTSRTQEIRGVFDAISVIIMQTGKDPSSEEIRNYLISKDPKKYRTITAKSIEEMLAADKKPVSLDVPFNDSKDTSESTLLDVIESDSVQPDRSSIESSYLGAVNELIKNLNRTTKEIILRRHGIHKKGYEESFSDIGDSLGMSGERARQIYSQGIKKLSVKAKKIGYTADNII